MVTYTFDELSERAQAAAINRYYANEDYQNFLGEVAKRNVDDIPMVEDWARECNIRFNEHGERIV